MRIIRSTLTLVGLCLLMFAVYTWRQAHDPLAGYVQAQGTVVSVLTFRSGNSVASGASSASGASAPSVSRHPVIEFTDQRGEIIHFTPMTDRYSSASKGSRMNVLYSPFQPQQAVINDFFSLWKMPLIVGGLGAVSLLAGILFMLIPRLRKRQDKLQS
jgi:hypothetical protein